jgi:transcription antitermination factor NusG
MDIRTYQEPQITGNVGLLEQDRQPRWYAIYTSANHEKCVHEQLGRRGIESFLPLYASVRQWKDRKVRLQLPLFPNYLFARIALRDRLQVLRVPGVARFVGFHAGPCALQETEIESLRRVTRALPSFRAEPYPYLTAGRCVQVKTGPLAGIAGILVERRNGTRFVISVDLIMRSVAIELDAKELEPQ